MCLSILNVLSLYLGSVKQQQQQQFCLQICFLQHSNSEELLVFRFAHFRGMSLFIEDDLIMLIFSGS